MGIYPAVDPLASTSRALEPSVVGQEHYDVAREVQSTLQNIESYKILLRFLVWMNYQMKINKLWNEHVEFNSSYHKTSTLQNNLLDKRFICTC